jgi:transposase
MKHSITFVGLDVHKDTIDIAIAESGGDKEVRHFGKIDGDIAALDKAVRKLQSKGAKLHFAYEAGPCGYDIHRRLTMLGFTCIVVAPSLIPKKSGDRVKTDRRDAISLARLYRSGDLTAVYVPREDDEAMRDLTRAREDAVNASRTARQRLCAMLLRLGYRYGRKTTWNAAYFNWLSTIKMPHPAQQIAFQEYIHAVRECGERVNRLTEQIHKLIPEWRLAPVVKALQAMRGVSVMVATTTVAEIGDLSRFANPRQLMAYLGLVPSENSSGKKEKRGGITKTGNGHVRRALVEAAQTYHYQARVSRLLLARQEGLPESIRKIAWKAQVRLCGRFRKLTGRGKTRNKVVTAIARELAAFMWAIAKEVPVQYA